MQTKLTNHYGRKYTTTIVAVIDVIKIPLMSTR